MPDSDRNKKRYHPARNVKVVEEGAEEEEPSREPTRIPPAGQKKTGPGAVAAKDKRRMQVPPSSPARSRGTPRKGSKGAKRGGRSVPGAAALPGGAPQDKAVPGKAAVPSGQNQDTVDVVKAMRRQEKIRARQAAQEAQQLETEARRKRKEARSRERFTADFERHQQYVRSLGPKLGRKADRAITQIPELPDGHRQVELTPVVEGRAYVRVSYDPRKNRYAYEVLEPVLDETEQEAKEFLRDTLIRTMDGRLEPGQRDWHEYLTDAIHEAIRDHSVLVDEISTAKLEYHLVRDLLGFGPIDVLMRDPMLEDISCDGPNIPIFLFHRQYESIRTNIVFASDADLDSFVIRLAQMSGKHISIADPLLDATLPDGSRLQTTLSKEVTTRGSSFTIRKFRGDPMTPPDLITLGTMSLELAAYMWFLLEHGLSLLLAGGTASGKTTSLNAVCQFIPPQKKVVSIEDTREINLDHENWIAGVTRTGFGGEVVGGKTTGTIDMYDLLEAALRQRPEFLLVGEVRGPEALTLFQAMATGHAVYSTMHADSVSSAVYRLENEPINVPRMMLQTVDVIAIQQQVRMHDRMVRRIIEVTEVVGFEPDTGDLLTNTVFEWDVTRDTHTYLGKSYVMEQVMTMENLSEAEVLEEWRQRQRVLEWMIHKGIRRYDAVANVLSAYYRDPTSVMARVDEDLPPEEE